MTGQRHVEYLFRLWNGELLLVTAVDVLAAPGHYYESFRLYIGAEDEPMEQLDVSGVNRWKDGGTTGIYTADADLFSPSPLVLDRGATWDEHPVTALDPDEYAIDEPEDGPAVVRRVAAAATVGS